MVTVLEVLHEMLLLRMEGQSVFFRMLRGGTRTALIDGKKKVSAVGLEEKELGDSIGTAGGNGVGSQNFRVCSSTSTRAST